ncbi:MAG: hypothetical protein O8C60_02565 [Candidatus Methanoperedens sp.]|nr:hypothetical protein [Candidatus Methanoperedens sp.]
MTNIKRIAVVLVILLFLLVGSTDATTIANRSSNLAYAVDLEPISSQQSRYVWEEGMEPVFNLTPLNFDILYYDIDRDAGGEIMNIDIGDPSRRTIDVDNLTY